MARNSYKILINSPGKSLFQGLQKQFLYQNVVLFYLSDMEGIRGFWERIKPQVILIHPPSKKTDLEAVINIAAECSRSGSTWFILLLNEKLLGEKSALAGASKNVLVFNESLGKEELALNLLNFKDWHIYLNNLEEKSEFERQINQYLKIIHRETNLPRLFNRLLNYLPKIIDLEYWAIFRVDPDFQKIIDFTQFAPPVRKQSFVHTTNIEKIAESWLERRASLALNSEEDPKMFQKLREWGWPVKSLFFFPAMVKERAIGGIIAARSDSKELSGGAYRLINDLAKLLAQRILELSTPRQRRKETDAFAENLILNRFSDDSIYQLACKNLNIITHADSSVFWQYNKGFGFVFPKFFYLREGSSAWKSLEKLMIYAGGEKFLTRLILQNKIRVFDRVLQDTRFDKSTREVFEHLNYNNIMFIPIEVNSEKIGAFIINKKENDADFSGWEIQEVEEVTHKIQKVLSDSVIVKEAKLKLKQLSRIFELGNEIKLNLDLDEMLSRIISGVRRALGWNDIAVLTVDELGKSLKLANILGFKKKPGIGFNLQLKINLKKFEAFLTKTTPLSNSFFYSAALNQSLEDARPEEGSSNAWDDDDLLIVPLETRQKILGYMLVQDPVDRLKPTTEKVLPLEYYANQAAVAVENYLLYEKLLASEGRYRSLAETMSLGLITCEKDGKILYTNPAFQQLVGLSENALHSKSIQQFFSTESQIRLLEISRDLLKEKNSNGKRIENLELTLVSTTGETIPVSTFAFPYFQQRKNVGFFLVLNDLRVFKRLERMKADFNSMIVHDLRSPMNVIQGFIELIRNRVVGKINTEQEELLDIAKENVKKVLTLIDNFLVASKMEIGKFTIDPKLNEINSLVERIVENHKILAKNKNIKIQRKLDKNLPLVFFDSLRIEQVVNNLLSNAMKFTPESGKILVQTKLNRRTIKGEEKFFAKIMVKDTGVGIPNERLEKIFERYEQVESNGKLNPKGTGLGLAICKEIINLHGGDIGAESVPGKGSTFTIQLPIEPSIEKIIK